MKTRLIYLLLTATLALIAAGTSIAAIRTKSDLLFFVPFAVLSAFGTLLMLIFSAKQWKNPVPMKTQLS